MKFKINLQRKWIVYIGILAVAAIIMAGASVNHKEHQEGMLEDTAWQQEEDGSYGMKAFEIGRDKGKHTLFVAYDAKDELEYRLVDLQRNDGNNHLGKVIASGNFPGDQGETVLEFELEEAAVRLALFLKTRDESAKMGYWIIESYGSGHGDFILVFFLFAIGLFFVFYCKNQKQWRAWGAMAGVGIILTLPYMSSVLMEGHDLLFHLERIRGLAEALKSGQVPVRINPCFTTGYGFSSPMMYPELFLYIPAVLYVMNVSVITAYKLFMLCINLATAGVSYYSFSRVFGSDKLGMACAFFYLVNPYRLVNMYHRAALGEALAQVFLPLLFLGIYELFFRDYRKWWICMAAATGIVQSHILSVEMCLLFAGVFVVFAIPYWWKHEGVKRVFAAVKAAVAATGLNLWFLVPFLDHFRDDLFIRSQATDMQNSALDFYELFRMAVKFNSPYTDNTINRQEFITLGGAVLFGILVYCAYLAEHYMSEQKIVSAESVTDVWKPKGIMADRKVFWIGNICLGLGLVSCYLVTRTFPWNWIKENDGLYQMVGIIQFPWRFLVFAVLFFSVVMGIVLMELLRDKRQAAAAVLVGLSVFMMFSCMDMYTMKPIVLNGHSDISSCCAVDYYAEDTDVESMWANGDIVVSNNDIIVSDYRRKGMNISFSYSNAKEGTVLQFPIYNYGMHRIYLDGQELKAAEGQNHLLEAKIPEGYDEGLVEVRYKEPGLYILGNIISFLTAAGMLAYGYCSRLRDAQYSASRENMIQG